MVYSTTRPPSRQFNVLPRTENRAVATLDSMEATPPSELIIRQRAWLRRSVRLVAALGSINGVDSGLVRIINGVDGGLDGQVLVRWTWNQSDFINLQWPQTSRQGSHWSCASKQVARLSRVREK